MDEDAVWYAPGWKFRDIRAFVKGTPFSLEQLLPGIVRYDAWGMYAIRVADLHLSGRKRCADDSSPDPEYFADLEAPLKKMETIADPGHFAGFLQPDQLLDAPDSRPPTRAHA